MSNRSDLTELVTTVAAIGGNPLLPAAARHALTLAARVIEGQGARLSAIEDRLASIDAAAPSALAAVLIERAENELA